MLSLLRIQNLAIIEETEISFTAGLNIISGETGAGKSILLEAIELLCAKRANVELVRSGADRCVVEAAITIPKDKVAQLQKLIPTLEDEAIEELLLRRVVEANGKSRCFINGALSNLKQLASVSELLIDVTRQHAQQLLLREGEHRGLLDAYGVNKELLAEVSSNYRDYKRALERLNEFRSSTAERAERIRRLRIEHEELEKADLSAGEREEVEQELSLEANSETLLAATTECLELLEGGERSIESSLRRALNLLESASELDSRLLETKKLVETASIEISEAVLECSDYQSSLNSDPQHLETLRERLAIIARLERKYGRPCQELCQYFLEISEELSDFDSGALDECSLVAEVERLEKILRASESLLTEARIKVGKNLSKKVEKELAQLNMKKARFEVSIEAGESSLHGADVIGFRLAANPGEPFQPLTKVASGGELSRLLLVLKALLARQLTPVVNVFDEIDSGIGGAVAQVVGEKLRSLAECSQVIAVTHAPQVAAIAESHHVVAKRVVEGRTVSQSTRLDGQLRIEHIAGMLAGKEVTDSFRDSAKQLLEIVGKKNNKNNRRANA